MGRARGTAADHVGRAQLQLPQDRSAARLLESKQLDRTWASWLSLGGDGCAGFGAQPQEAQCSLGVKVCVCEGRWCPGRESPDWDYNCLEVDMGRGRRKEGDAGPP